MDLSIVRESLGLYFQGLWTTIWMVAVAVVAGLCLAVPLAVARTSRNPLINWPVWAYTYFFRGTPLLIQLFLIYYGLGQFQIVQNSVLWPLLKEAWFCALLAFALAYAPRQSRNRVLVGAVLALLLILGALVVLQTANLSGLPQLPPGLL